MKKKMLAMALAGTMAALALTGCGSGKGSAAASSAAETTAAATTEAANSSTETEQTASAGDASAWKPTKTINIYCTHSAGGDTDYMARLLAKNLETELGVTVVVSNVAGSNGATCMQQYKDGPKDGYTFIASNTAALNGNEVTGMVDFGYDAFEPVAVYGIQSGENLVVPANAPYDDLQSLLDATKKNPGQIKLGISTGGGVYIESAVLQNLGGAQFNVIDEGDAATRLTALLGGAIDVTSLPYSTAADYIKDGQLKSLCTLLSKAPTLLPDQKTASETIPELKIDTEYVLLAPKGTDANAVAAVNAAIVNISKTDEWKEAVNSYCYQDPYVLNVDDTIQNLKEQRDLFMSFKDFLK
ncbi:MAG: tripartite tricarboxylate transporter substrate-binding protein [Firmicutes bacterium]|nr:tripartite tricarboxylate transporter substrate-binding protein [Bacillota bacterium]